jgi:HlyD family secretion protein
VPSIAEPGTIPIATPLPAVPRPAPVPQRRRPTTFIVSVIVLAAIGSIALRVRARLLAPPPPQTVTASGRIEGRQVTLAPKDIQGRVKRLLVDEGATVARGQLLAELDAAQLDARDAGLDAAIAALDAQIAQATLDVAYTAKSSDAAIAAADAGVSGARAHAIRAGAVLTNARADHDRAMALYRDNVISGHERDQFELSLRVSEADVEAAGKDLAHAEAVLAQARAATDTIGLKRQQLRALQQNRQAAVAQRAELAATRSERFIVAPADGTILSRPVEVGDVVSPGSAMFVLVDLNRLYLKVYVPEPDIPKIRLGDRADVSVDAFPGRRFTARVSKISDQAEFTPKNVETREERLKLVFGVELAFTDGAGVLKPGMPADCVIHWEQDRAPEAAHGW